MIIERIFQVTAAALAGAAAYFFWQGSPDAGFIAVVLGSVAFLLSVRFQVKERNRLREAERERAMAGSEQEAREDG
ncbi:MAG TPA: hypothetical protein VK918_05935 [Pyrinomonadaceae bacterium]|nr:hypothetical protein [Pyrinomonadaceae bacterium]